MKIYFILELAIIFICIIKNILNSCCICLKLSVAIRSKLLYIFYLKVGTITQEIINKS
jgi:hypothetical protein